MKVKLNDKFYEIAEGVTLSEFIGALGIQLQGIAVAIDYEVVPKDQWNEVVLTDQMELMMIHAVSGG